jgi:antitoxin HigA-1
MACGARRRVPFAPCPFGLPPAGNSRKSTACVIFMSLPFLLAIVSNAWREIERASGAFGSTINTESVSSGRMAMPTASRSRTTTSAKRQASMPGRRSSLVTRRLPKFRPPTHPGEMLLEEFLKPLGITQSEFALRIGVSFPRLNEIIRRKRGVTPDTALRLARVLGMSADFWLGLQQDWDLWHAMRTLAATRIRALKPLRLRQRTTG